MLHIENTYHEIKDLDTRQIEQFLAMQGSVFIIGSGGSFSAAKAVEYQLSRLGIWAKAITPLQLRDHERVIPYSRVILLTASGNNHDIINAFTYCQELEAEAILCICMSQKSKIREKFLNNGHLFLWEHSMSLGKDGYLSVNSLIAMIVIFSQSLYRYSGDTYYQCKMKNFMAEDMVVRYLQNPVLCRETIIVLHGGQTTSAAYDLESKFSEAALGNIQLVDFRNFAHGRHFWLQQRGKQTGVVALITKQDKEIADKTLACIPEEIPVQCLYCEDGNDGVIQLFAEIFSIVFAAGKRIGINPGKPSVPEFGRKLYHVNYNVNKNDRHNMLKNSALYRAVFRKTGLTDQNDILWNIYKEQAQQYLNHLENTEWECVIFDYDGTLHTKDLDSNYESQIMNLLNEWLSHGVKVGISTGRGRSVRVELQKKIPREYWEQVGIGYYNGGIFGWLNEDSIPNREADMVSALEQLYEQVNAVLPLENIVEEYEPPKATQWTLRFRNRLQKDKVMEIIEEQVREKDTLKMVASSHSIDILPQEISKVDILSSIKKRYTGLEQKKVLFIGDSGKYGGNDYEMLQQGGLSVDTFSASLNHCWNFAPIGMRQLEATLYYMNHMSITKDNKIRIHL